jgi:hypothetical protein
MTKKTQYPGHVNPQILQRVLRQLTLIAYACFSTSVYEILAAET